MRLQKTKNPKQRKYLKYNVDGDRDFTVQKVLIQIKKQTKFSIFYNFSHFLYTPIRYRFHIIIFKDNLQKIFVRM